MALPTGRTRRTLRGSASPALGLPEIDKPASADLARKIGHRSAFGHLAAKIIAEGDKA